MKWAVIGLGGAGTAHARRIAEMPELELVGGYDPRADAREAFAQALQVAASESLDSLLANPALDGVTVAAICRTQISIQKLVVQAYGEGSRQALLQALMLDPVVDNLSRAEAMMNRLLDLERDFLPELK